MDNQGELPGEGIAPVRKGCIQVFENPMVPCNP